MALLDFLKTQYNNYQQSDIPVASLLRGESEDFIPSVGRNLEQQLSLLSTPEGAMDLVNPIGKIGGLLGMTKASSLLNKKYVTEGLGSYPVNIIAKNKPIYRETSPDKLEEFLINNQSEITSPMYVSDNIDLALGQGKNKGALIEFLPNTVSGNLKLKPGQSEESIIKSGGEYLSNAISPQPLNKITFKEKGWLKKITPTTRKLLKKSFNKTKNGDITIFTRKQ